MSFQFHSAISAAVKNLKKRRLRRKIVGRTHPTAVIEGLEPRQLLSTTVAGQTITTAVTWTAANSPYNLTGDVTIASGGSLAIQSGVTVSATSLRIYVGSG